jgi:hypothetical protein
MNRRSAFLAAAVLLAISLAVPVFAAESTGQLDDCIHMWICDVWARPGEDIMVPVNISNTTGWGIMAVEGEICWCDLPAGLLQFQECVAGPVAIESGWVVGECGFCGPNCITFAAAHFAPLQGEGTLLYLKFHVSANAKPCMCCPLRFEYVNLYDPEKPLNVCLDGGEVCIEHCDIMGCVTAWYCRYDCDKMIWPFGLPGVMVHLSECNDPVATTYTNDKGYFEFTCLEPHDIRTLEDGCPYCINVDYCCIPQRAICAFDASLILRYLVCLDALDCCEFYDCGCGVQYYPQQIAADVNCTGLITAYDASLILQYVVGIIPTFPCPDMWSWHVMGCNWCTYDCPGFFHVMGVLKGDVSGFCYDGGGDLLASNAKIKLGIPQYRNGFVDIPVMVSNTSDVFSVQFSLDYDNQAYTFDSVRSAGLTEGFMATSHEADGAVNVAMASAESFSGNGRVAVARFIRNGGPFPAVSSPVRIESALLNETEPVIEGRPFEDHIVDYSLGPVAPNPFTEGTVISYSAPKASHVTLSVYNVNGQLVRTVEDGQVEAGDHVIAWDGTDSNGVRVSRGVYFCRMKTDEFSATEKMVLLK